jgi:hypothetical protein
MGRVAKGRGRGLRLSIRKFILAIVLKVQRRRPDPVFDVSVSPCRLKVVRNNYIHLSKAGSLREHGGSAGDSPVMMLHESLDLKTIAEEKEISSDFSHTAAFLFSPNDTQSSLEQKIADCLHWFRKGEEADRLEDRLLHYWIVMEKMFALLGAIAGAGAATAANLLGANLRAVFVTRHLTNTGAGASARFRAASRLISGGIRRLETEAA